MVPRYLTLEEQYKFLKSLAKQYEHVQLKVAIAQIEIALDETYVITQTLQLLGGSLTNWNALDEMSMMTKLLHLINFRWWGTPR